jgi:alpha-L-arabinofuranosidase
VIWIGRGGAALLAKTCTMNDLLAEHSAIMDKYDPKKQLGLAIDEWGGLAEGQVGHRLPSAAVV